jgi:hypothetical protein
MIWPSIASRQMYRKPISPGEPHYNTKPQRSYTPSKEFYKTPKNNPSEEYPLWMVEYLTKKMF